VGDKVPRKLRCWLACEDLEQENLFRPILQEMFGKHRIRVLPRKPNGGVAFVLQQVEKCYQFVRQRPQESVGALIVVDGDEVGLEGRLAEIAAKSGAKGGNFDERVAKCIPSRTVETSEMWLCGERDLNETTEYKDAFRREVQRGRMSSGKAVLAWFTSRSAHDVALEKALLPALAHGRKELGRLEKFAKG